MKKITALFSVISLTILTGCIVFPPSEDEEIMPEIVEQVSVPVVEIINDLEIPVDDSAMTDGIPLPIDDPALTAEGILDDVTLQEMPPIPNNMVEQVSSSVNADFGDLPPTDENL